MRAAKAPNPVESALKKLNFPLNFGKKALSDYFCVRPLINTEWIGADYQGKLISIGTTFGNRSPTFGFNLVAKNASTPCR
jgi:hypothetical protein